MKFLFGLLVGLGLGVAIGLLMAPQTGEDTRAQLSEQGVMLRNRSTSLPGEIRTPRPTHFHRAANSTSAQRPS